MSDFLHLSYFLRVPYLTELEREHRKAHPVIETGRATIVILLIPSPLPGRALHLIFHSSGVGPEKKVFMNGKWLFLQHRTYSEIGIFFERY